MTTWTQSDEWLPTLSVQPVTDARAQFVALACGIFFDRRCGPGCAVQLLRGSFDVLAILGRGWVVCPTRHVVSLVDKCVHHKEAVWSVRCCVFLELSPTLGVVSCACWLPPKLKGIHGIPGSSHFIVSLKGQEYVINNKGRFVRGLQPLDISGTWCCNSKWLVNTSCMYLTLWRIQNGQPKNPGVHVALGDLNCIRSGFPPGDGEELAVIGEDQSSYILFVDLPHSLEHSTIVIAKRVPLPFSSAFNMLWVSTNELLTLHFFEEGFKVYNTVSQRVKIFSSRYSELDTYSSSHLIATIDKETAKKLGIKQEVFRASDFDTPCNCIKHTTVHMQSPVGTGVYTAPCSDSKRWWFLTSDAVSFQIKDLITGSALAIITATWTPPGASDIEENLMLHNTRPMSPPFPTTH
ncbi:hypothetical protein Pelo_18844 [Pelomyxa schiedti]|nr:hypothetical protein Pelo_18844 [Pelomyxa schiedti]